MSVADNFGIAGVVYSQIKTMSPWAMAAWGAKELDFMILYLSSFIESSHCASIFGFRKNS